MTPDTILDIKDLCAYYRVLKGDVKALDGLTFQVKKGEILGVAGESGCGKSTLANTLILRKKPLQHISGSAMFLGKDIMTMPEETFRHMRFRDISIIPQYALDALSPTKKIKTFITDMSHQHDIETNAAFYKKVADRFGMVNLDQNVLNKYPVELSG